MTDSVKSCKAYGLPEVVAIGPEIILLAETDERFTIDKDPSYP